MSKYTIDGWVATNSSGATLFHKEEPSLHLSYFGATWMCNDDCDEEIIFLEQKEVPKDDDEVEKSLKKATLTVEVKDE